MARKESAVCETCGKEFQYYRSTLRGKDARFCSRKCIKHVAWNKGIVDFSNCLNCESKIRAWKKYCNQDCYHEHVDVSERLPEPMIGSDNPNWKGGIKASNSNARRIFSQTIAKDVLERDNYTCQMCGERSGELNVDHIQPWSEYVEGRFCMDNCRTVCIDCHYEITWGRPRPKGNTWGKSHNLKGNIYG